MKDSDIHKVMKLLEAELRQFGLPPVSAMAEEAIVDPFKILISTIISARTKDEVTGPATERLFALAASPATMSALPEENDREGHLPRRVLPHEGQGHPEGLEGARRAIRLPRSRHDR